MSTEDSRRPPSVGDGLWQSDEDRIISVSPSNFTNPSIEAVQVRARHHSISIERAVKPPKSNMKNSAPLTPTRLIDEEDAGDSRKKTAVTPFAGNVKLGRRSVSPDITHQKSSKELPPLKHRGEIQGATAFSGVKINSRPPSKTPTSMRPHTRQGGGFPPNPTGTQRPASRTGTQYMPINTMNASSMQSLLNLRSLPKALRTNSFESLLSTVPDVDLWLMLQQKENEFSTEEQSYSFPFPFIPYEATEEQTPQSSPPISSPSTPSLNSSPRSLPPLQEKSKRRSELNKMDYIAEKKSNDDFDEWNERMKQLVDKKRSEMEKK